jgi:hypothetical protein
MQRACPYCGENPGPGKDVEGELEPRPGIREQPGSKAAEMIGTMRWPMSALLPKADITASLSENPL